MEKLIWIFWTCWIPFPFPSSSTSDPHFWKSVFVFVFFLSTSVPVTRGIIGRRAGVGCDWESRGIGWVLFWKSSNVYFCKTLLPQWVLNLKDCIPLAFDRTQVWWLHSVTISVDAMSASNPVVLNMCCSLNAGHRDSQCEWMNGSVCVSEWRVMQSVKLRNDFTCVGKGRFKLKLPLYRNQVMISFCVCSLFLTWKNRIKVLL